MPGRVTLPATVDHHAHFRVWQRNGYDINLWTAKNVEGKLHAQLPVRLRFTPAFHAKSTCKIEPLHFMLTL